MSILLFLLIANAAPAQAAVPGAKALAGFDKPVPAGKVSTANPRSIVAVLQKEGYRAKLVVEDGKKPFIESAAEGATFYIYLENCDHERDCKDVMFSSSYTVNKDKPVSLDKVNEYNRDNRWGRAYLAKDGSPTLEYDVLFTDQMVDEKAFSEALAIWDNVLGTFHKAIDW